MLGEGMPANRVVGPVLAVLVVAGVGYGIYRSATDVRSRRGAGGEDQVTRKSPAAFSALVYHQRHGPLDLRTQRDAGRVLRPSRGNRGRRAARLLHAVDGRSRGDAVGARHLRADGERLAGGGAR